MIDDDQAEPRSRSRRDVLAAGAVALLVCAFLIGLFVWQPWSPNAPPVRPASADAR
jgi:ferric-dicitrate binding protein FerR (iron transport regulator)